MFRSLRNRLILSHILPVLLIIPLMGVVMVYVIETQVLLPMVYRNLVEDATLIAEITRNQPIFWQNDEAAQALVDGIDPYLSGRISFVTVDGRLLASSERTGDGLNGEIVELPDLAGVRQGEVIQLQRGPLAEVFTPVYDLRGELIGIIRMTTPVVTVSEQIYESRYLLVIILLFGVLAGVGLGSYLAFSINHPIQRVTRSIQALVQGDRQAHVVEQGPDEIRALARTVNTLVDQLNSLENARRQLLANLMHELGSPLGAIRSAIQALLKGAGQDPQLASELLSGIDSETARLQRLLDDLWELHDQVLGKQELNRRLVQLNEWLASTLAPWEAAAREKGFRWETNFTGDLPAILIDPDRMAQAIGNILSNAIKFTPAGGHISIRTAFVDRQLTIEISDTGPGIPPEEQEKIFQPFYRGSQGRRILEGMGLGLSIVRDIVTAHGGTVELESASGQGTRFILQIPVEIVAEGEGI
jgi:two-component system, OmpR family, sensor histidine kinase BaeS